MNARTYTFQAFDLGLPESPSEWPHRLRDNGFVLTRKSSIQNWTKGQDADPGFVYTTPDSSVVYFVLAE